MGFLKWCVAGNSAAQAGASEGTSCVRCRCLAERVVFLEDRLSFMEEQCASFERQCDATAGQAPSSRQLPWWLMQADDAMEAAAVLEHPSQPSSASPSQTSHASNSSTCLHHQAPRAAAAEPEDLSRLPADLARTDCLLDALEKLFETPSPKGEPKREPAACLHKASPDGKATADDTQARAALARDGESGAAGGHTSIGHDKDITESLPCKSMKLPDIPLEKCNQSHLSRAHSPQCHSPEHRQRDLSPCARVPVTLRIPNWGDVR